MAEQSPLNHSGGNEPMVTLWTSAIPMLGKIAEHHWLVISDEGSHTRWEVWQSANVICNDIGESWDHLHRDLLPPEQGVGNGPAYKLCAWLDDDARYLIDRITTSPQRYPWCSQYRYWPGPNSNTYIQWILLGMHTLGRKGLGKRYCWFDRGSDNRMA